jgi:hypothetical protein
MLSFPAAARTRPAAVLGADAPHPLCGLSDDVTPRLANRVNRAMSLCVDPRTTTSSRQAIWSSSGTMFGCENGEKGLPPARLSMTAGSAADPEGRRCDRRGISYVPRRRRVEPVRCLERAGGLARGGVGAQPVRAQGQILDRRAESVGAAISSSSSPLPRSGLQLRPGARAISS